ncbi:MAG: DUF86 domain-containing protein [Nitrospirota bacterium]
MSERNDELYLNDIIDSVKAIRNFIKDVEFESFVKDRKTYSATIRELEIIGEAAGRVSAELKKNHPEIDWRTIKDFRNILSHEYFGIDNKIVWQIITEKLSVLYSQVIHITKAP